MEILNFRQTESFENSQRIREEQTDITCVFCLKNQSERANILVEGFFKPKNRFKTSPKEILLKLVKNSYFQKFQFTAQLPPKKKTKIIVGHRVLFNFSVPEA